LSVIKVEEYLKETRYCDFKNLVIQSKVNEIIKNCKDEREKAVKLFLWVRDNIKYAFDFWNRKASQTLKKGFGMCTNKTNLLVAMLRAAKSPAGYGILRVNAQEYFGPIMLPMFKDKVSTDSVHIYCYVNLDGKWIKCDPSTDKELSEKTSYFNYSTILVGWDGTKDEIDRIAPEHIYEDLGLFPNIDDRLEVKPKLFNKFKLKLGNYYIQFLRETKDHFSDVADIEPKFLQWLKRRHYLFFISSTFVRLHHL